MTKFVGVAKGSRHSRPQSTGADRRVALAMFQLTGEHPSALEEVTEGTALAVPEASRTQVHFIFAADGAPFGEPVVVELFDDKAPESAQAFRARALGAARDAAARAFEGAAVARVAENARVDVGEPAGKPSGAAQLEDDSLRHNAPGLVSVPLCAPSCFSILLQACPSLDGRQQVVGRVMSGLGTVEELSREPADEHGKPKRLLLVCAAGTFVAGSSGFGTDRVLALCAETKAQQATKAAAQRAETPAQTRARLQQESVAARNAVSDAVKEALNSNKRQKTGAEVAGPRGGMFGALLGGGSGSDESGSEDVA